MNMDQIFNEALNQPSDDVNLTDMPGKTKYKRYTSASGAQAARTAKTQRITRSYRMDLVKSKNLNTLMGQVDASFKMILAAAHNTSVESYVIGRLNMIRKQLNTRITAEIEKQTKK